MQVRIVRGLNVIIRGSLNDMSPKSNDAIKLEFGQSVRDIRVKKGLSQEGLAEMCELDRSYIGGVERGERNISLINIRRIADGLGISPRELFDPQ